MRGGEMKKLALLSLVLAVLSFVQLFGLEKAFLAAFLGVYVLKNSLRLEDEKSRRLALAAVAVAVLYIILLAVVLFSGGIGVVERLG